MTSLSGPNLNRAKIRRLLAAVGSMCDDGPVPEVAEYDWHDPHYFNEDQRNQLAAIMSQVAVLIAEKLCHFFNREYAVAPVSITERFAAEFRNLAELDRSHCLTFGSNAENPCGFLALRPETALKWVTRLLGDSESENEANRTLSALEESLLGDLACGMAETFLTPLRPHHKMHPSQQIVQGQPSIQFELTEAICRIAFEIKEGDSDESDEAAFLLPSHELAPLVKKTAATTSSLSPDEASRILIEHLHRMPVTVTATLASTVFRFAEIMEISCDDVLLLDKTIDGSVELVIDDHTVFRGRPAQSDGQYAVVITESVGGARPERSTSDTAKAKAK